MNNSPDEARGRAEMPGGIARAATMNEGNNMTTTDYDTTKWDPYALWKQDTFDSRDVRQAIQDIKERLDEGEGDGALEFILKTLNELDTTGEDSAEDWEWGVAVIRDSYFREYAQELAEDIGAIHDGMQWAQWPMYHIDWESAAHELKIDYTPLEVCGVTFWTR